MGDCHTWVIKNQQIKVPGCSETIIWFWYPAKNIMQIFDDLEIKLNRKRQTGSSMEDITSTYWGIRLVTAGAYRCAHTNVFQWWWELEEPKRLISCQRGDDQRNCLLHQSPAFFRLQLPAVLWAKSGFWMKNKGLSYYTEEKAIHRCLEDEGINVRPYFDPSIKRWYEKKAYPYIFFTFKLFIYFCEQSRYFDITAN